MMNKVCAMLRRASAWSDSCSCHAAFLQANAYDTLPSELKKAVDTCPMRCRRAAELSSGEFLAAVHDALQVSNAELIAELPRALPATDRQALLLDIDYALSHSVLYLTAKLSYASELPWSVVQIAHFDTDIVGAAARRALESKHPHPVLRTP